MNCRKVSHLLSAYIDGELPGVEHRQIHEHLAGCAECAQEHRGLVQMKRMLASLRLREPSADLPQRILSQVSAQPTLRAPWLDQINRWVQVQGLKPQSLALAATFALGGIVFASYTIDRIDTSDKTASLQNLPPAQMAWQQTSPLMQPTTIIDSEVLPGGSMPNGGYSNLPSMNQRYDSILVPPRRSPTQNSLFYAPPIYRRQP